MFGFDSRCVASANLRQKRVHWGGGMIITTKQLWQCECTLEYLVAFGLVTSALRNKAAQ